MSVIHVVFDRRVGEIRDMTEEEYQDYLLWLAEYRMMLTITGDFLGLISVIVVAIILGIIFANGG